MKAVACLLLPAFMWGLNFHLLKILLVDVHFIEAGFWRYLFGAGALFVCVRKAGLTWKGFVQNCSGILIVGVLGLFSFNVLLFWGMKFTSSMNASLIVSLSPLATLGLAYIFLGEEINSRQAWGACLGIIGVLYLLAGGNLTAVKNIIFSKGDLLVLSAMLLSASYHIWVNKYASKLPNGHFTLLTSLVCLAAFTIVSPFYNGFHIADYGKRFWIAAIALGFAGTALTYALWNKGVGRFGAGRAGVFMNMVPFSTAVTGMMFGIEIESFHIISGILILAGLLISQWMTGVAVSGKSG